MTFLPDDRPSCMPQVSQPLGEPSFLMSLLLFSSFLFPCCHSGSWNYSPTPGPSCILWLYVQSSFLCSPTFCLFPLTTTSVPKSYQSKLFKDQPHWFSPPINSPPCALVPATIFILSQAPSCLPFSPPTFKNECPRAHLVPPFSHLPGPVHPHTLITLNSYLSPDCSPPAPNSLLTSMRCLYLDVSVVSHTQDSQLDSALLPAPPGQKGYLIMSQITHITLYLKPLIRAGFSPIVAHEYIPCSQTCDYSACGDWKQSSPGLVP